MAREASPEPCWEEPELPEESPELSVLQPYPESFTSLISTDPSFRGLDLPPRGSVITYTLNPPAEQKEPSIFAVLVLEAWFGDDGVWVRVKFLGADQVWGKSAGISTFSRGKKDLHLCFQFGPQCGLLKGMHIREFGYWPPNTFKGAYVEEKKDGRSTEDIGRGVPAGQTRRRRTKIWRRPKIWRLYPGKTLRSSQKAHSLPRCRSWTATVRELRTFAKDSSKNCPDETQARGDGGGQFGQREGQKTEKEREAEGDRSSPLCSSGEAKNSRAERITEPFQAFEFQEEVEEEKEEKEKEEEGILFGFLVCFREQREQRRGVETPSTEEGREEARVHLENVDGPCEVIPFRYEPGRQRTGKCRKFSDVTGEGAELLPNPRQTASRVKGQRRERVVCFVSGNRPPPTWQCGESCRLTCRQVHSCGNSGLRRQLGRCTLARSSPLGRAGSCQCRSPFGGTSPSENDRQGIRPRLLQQLLGSWSAKWFRLGRLQSWLRSRSRTQRKGRKGQRQERESRKERKRAEVELVGGSSKRSRKGWEERRHQQIAGVGRGLGSPQLEASVDQLIEGARVAACSDCLMPPFPCLKKLQQEPQSSDKTGGQTMNVGDIGEAQAASVVGVPLAPLGPEDGHTVFGRSEVSQTYWFESVGLAEDLGQFGARLAWGIGRGYGGRGLESLKSIAKPFAATAPFSSSPGLFPLPVDFTKVKAWEWPQGCFSRDQCLEAWLCLSTAALNAFFGAKPPFPQHRSGRAVKKCLAVLRDRIDRFLNQPLENSVSIQEVWDDISKKQINYSGEEVAMAQMLTVDQVLKSLPPLGHGGSVELAPLLHGRTRYLLENPEQVLLRHPGRAGGKHTAKVHIAKGEEVALFQLMFERGVVDFVREDDVFRDAEGPYLSGLFGVPKPSKVTEKGLPVLRLIMNLIPINKAMDVILGDIAELPSATSWQQLVLVDGDSISTSQADMASAFYLFRIPPCWQKYLCFNFKLTRSEAGLSGPGFVYPACRVLPMGWSSSVGIMQMASRELMRLASLPPGMELHKRSLVPHWFVDLLPTCKGSLAWWQVYLDNFMATVVRQGPPEGLDQHLHVGALDSWLDAGVLCSQDKNVYSAPIATELGVQIHGPLGLVGASIDRIFRAVLAGWKLISGSLSPIRTVQVVLGRWIFILQYRRPAMAVLSRSWDYINSKGRKLGTWKTLCAELVRLMCLSPLLQFDLKCPFSDLVTCSDASEKGGAAAASTGLTGPGRELETRLSSSSLDPLSVELLVVSAFNGIGGCFRAYDLAGVRPCALVSIEIDPAARRVVRNLWPHALEVADVQDVDREMIREWANMFPRVTEVHAWGGFPCVHLSSARSDRMNLEGEGSNLFFKLVEVIELLEETYLPTVPVEFVVENVFSMDVAARREISMRLDVIPLKLDPADCSPMSRPRLAWVSKAVEPTPGVTLVDWADYVEVKMAADFPGISSWVSEGWKPTVRGVKYPTFMKSIVRSRPPPNPAGLRRCDGSTVHRWQSDSFRFPPYQYSYEYLVKDEDGNLRYLDPTERELLMGMGFNATEFCFAASFIKAHKQEYWDKRLSLLGDGFAMLSFAWVASQLCKHWMPPLTPQQIVDRFGLAPGASLQAGIRAPLERRLSYGQPEVIEFLPQSLVSHISRHVAHNGSDVSISLGIPFSSKQGNHVSLRAPWWGWRILFSSKWKFKSHINALEMRAILQSLKWRSRSPDNFSTRWLHLADSMVCNYILSKGRTSSRLLQPLVQQHGALLLAMNGHELHGHVDSSENPTDSASRS